MKYITGGLDLWSTGLPVSISENIPTSDLSARQSSVVCLSQEKNRTNESEVAKMDKLIHFVREPLLEKESKGGEENTT